MFCTDTSIRRSLAPVIIEQVTLVTYECQAALAASAYIQLTMKEISHGRGVVANTLKAVDADGAVGFIDWLDVAWCTVVIV